MFDLILIAGLWITACVQTQTPNAQGHAVETYGISETGDYEYSRTWYRDANCSRPFMEEQESGRMEVGEKIGGMFAGPSTYAADFKSSEGTDLGAIEIKDGLLKIARGTKGGGMRNTMLSLFGFKKIR